jgi:hypothetical protein
MKGLLVAAAAAAMMLPAAAQAQDTGSGLYAGAQVGYHDYGSNIDATILGGYVGFNAPVGETLVGGLEGNYNFGIGGDADAEYGVSAHLGFRTGTGMVFGRAGYQEVNFDFGPNDDAGDDTAGGWLVGIGGEFGFGANTAFRVALDTIEFDSARITGGITFHF